MRYYIARALTTLSVLICLSAVAQSRSGVWQVVFFVGLLISLDLREKLGVLRWEQEYVPYEWDCPRCSARDSRAYFGSTSEDAVETFRYLHNRSLHLEEY